MCLCKPLFLEYALHDTANLQGESCASLINITHLAIKNLHRSMCSWFPCPKATTQKLKPFIHYPGYIIQTSVGVFSLLRSRENCLISHSSLAFTAAILLPGYSVWESLVCLLPVPGAFSSSDTSAFSITLDMKSVHLLTNPHILVETLLIFLISETSRKSSDCRWYKKVL